MQLLRVNMDRLTVESQDLGDAYGSWAGRGLIARLLSDEVPAACDPLGPQNKLVVTNGLLAGTRTSSAGRLSVGAKSPLTLGIKEANAGGVMGDAMARQGVRAIVVEGTAPTEALYLLEIGAAGARLLPADDLRGLGTYAVAAELLQRYGDKAALACIGPAGELRLPLAGVAVNDREGRPSRFAGRGGMGAVMGAKNLKAIVVLPDAPGDAPIHDMAAFREARKRLNEALRSNPVTGRLFADLGTAMSLDIVRALGGMPICNFSRGDSDGELPYFTGGGFRQLIVDRGGEGTPTHACMPGCVIRCSNVFPDSEGTEIVGPLEYESLVLLGPNLGLFDVDQIARLNYLCNDYGVDTMEAGVALGVALEAGLASFGDYEAIVALLDEVSRGTVVGRVLGNGATVAGRVLGVTRVPAVKGQGMAAYDPRAVKGFGVTYATSTMGADHTAGYVMGAQVDHHSPVGAAQLSRKTQVLRAALDTINLCAFVMSALMDKPDILPDLINAVHGTDYGPGFVGELGEAVLASELAFNAAAGITVLDDRLPEFMRTEALPPQDVVFDVPQEELDGLLRTDRVSSMQITGGKP